MNIALIGMMGCGKTTLGRYIAEILNGYSFVDTDEMIVRQEKMSINEIFSLMGENHFREVETEILCKVLNKNNQIISTGGGIIKSENNITMLKRKSFVIYLRADTETLLERVKNNKERPLLNVNDIKNEIRKLLAERKQKYEKADLIIDIKNKTPDIILKEILNKQNFSGSMNV